MLASALLLVAATIACPVERASYVLRDSPAITAHFESVPVNADWQAGLVLAIHGEATGRTTYWLPWLGGTDGGQHVRATEIIRCAQERDAWRRREHRENLDFFTTDARYRFMTTQPHRGSAAPAHLLLPDLDLWHAAEVNGHRDSTPRAFFDRTGCGRATGADVGRYIVLPTVP